MNEYGELTFNITTNDLKRADVLQQVVQHRININKWEITRTGAHNALLPPEGDPRRMWAASWTLDASINTFVPHWIIG
jgi:hypothetical protein